MAPAAKAAKAAKAALVEAAPAVEKKHVVAPPPLAPPSFGVADVRKAIPAELFERSTFWSLFHTAVDLVKIAATAYAMLQLDRSSLPFAAKAVAWPALWYLQGAFMTGVWVIAHECGHQAFSASKTINDAVGLVLVRPVGGRGRGRGRGGLRAGVRREAAGDPRRAAARLRIASSRRRARRRRGGMEKRLPRLPAA